MHTATRYSLSVVATQICRNALVEAENLKSPEATGFKAHCDAAHLLIAGLEKYELKPVKALMRLGFNLKRAQAVTRDTVARSTVKVPGRGVNLTPHYDLSIQLAGTLVSQNNAHEIQVHHLLGGVLLTNRSIVKHLIQTAGTSVPRALEVLELEWHETGRR